MFRRNVGDDIACYFNDPQVVYVVYKTKQQANLNDQEKNVQPTAMLRIYKNWAYRFGVLKIVRETFVKPLNKCISQLEKMQILPQYICSCYTFEWIS